MGTDVVDFSLHRGNKLEAVRSQHHTARIKSIDYVDDEKIFGVVGTLIAKDINGSNNIGVDSQGRTHAVS
jgi:xanthine dehydrogenase molybdopterin-binding subunit B